ncbi:MAG: Flp family type IVb pilin [Acidobacteriaceae bacterium]|nr:Flp family type IVb pilin [Acidobacteriaceae bacterium]
MNTSALYAFWQEEDGQDLVEYSLLLAFIALAAIAILSAASKNISTLWTDISDALQDATTAAS